MVMTDFRKFVCFNQPLAKDISFIVSWCHEFIDLA